MIPLLPCCALIASCLFLPCRTEKLFASFLKINITAIKLSLVFKRLTGDVWEAIAAAKGTGAKMGGKV